MDEYRKAWGLFIDDVRDLEYIDTSHTSEWHVARNSNDAIRLVSKYGLPTFISFDHDLGGADTSMRFLRWLEHDTGWLDKCPPPRYRVHSSNPVGSQNIISFMESWAKHHKRLNAFK